MSFHINLHEPSFDEEDEKYVLESIRSTWVSTGGPFVNKFEKQFAEYVGAKHAISVCNGTLGLQLSLECLKRSVNTYDNFDVLLPSLTFIATANSIVHAGGVPVFVDVQKNSFQICSQSLRDILLKNYEFSKLDKKWKNKKSKNFLLAIMPVHVMGLAVSILEIENISKEYNIPMIEDADEALGSFYLNQKHLGTTGIASVFSFNGNKILTTGGGGMIVTNDDEFALRLKHLSTTAKIDAINFIHDEVGYNYRMVNILAALGCSQLKKLSEKLELKKNIFLLYKESLIHNNVKLYEQNNCFPNYWLNNIILPNSEIRDNILNVLIQNNIQARPIWSPCHRQPAYKYLENNIRLENTDEIWEKTLTLPSSAHLEKDHIKFISDIINKKMNEF